MKKIIFWIFILAIILSIVFFAYQFYRYRQNNDITSLPQYYQTLAKTCQVINVTNAGTYDCCFNSVKAMAKAGLLISYKPYPGQPEPIQTCPDNFRENQLKCGGSFSWCEPIGN
ncbi:MAG: hypothetical protein PHW95_00015 [Patescibacteria group bacterium]|nr:hypothetical protein [Patescibacteria group bacterium]